MLTSFEVDCATVEDGLGWQNVAGRTGNIRIRRGPFMPALVAIQRDEAVRGLYDRLVMRGESKMKANVAVMREPSVLLGDGTRLEKVG